MPSTHATRNTDLIALAKVWRSQTGSFAGRSKELTNLDKALASFERLGNLGAVEEAFIAWKAKYTDGTRWQDSHRNKSRWRTFERLDAVLSGAGDSDAAFGTNAVVAANQINARQGILYLFGHTDVDTSVASVIVEGGLSIMGGALNYAGANIGAGGGLGNAAAAAAATNIGTSRVVLDQAIKIGIDTSSAPRDARSALNGLGGAQDNISRAYHEIKDRLRRWFTQFLNNLKTELMDKFGIVDMAISSVHNLVSVLVGALASSAAPIVGGAINMVTGLTQTLDRSMTNFKAWKAGKTVVLSEGHPAAVVSAITLAMKASLFEGLWTTLKGATSIGLSAMGGISAIVDMVVAGVEMIVKVVWRLAECHKIKAFCQDAAEHWRNDKGLEFASKPFAFNAWFRKSSLFIPSIPILTLNTGICGDKMVFLQMFDKGDANKVISQGDFDQGVSYIDGHLRPWGANYLSNCSYGFSSSKGDISAYLEHAKSHTSPEPEHKAWTVFKKLVKA